MYKGIRATKTTIIIIKYNIKKIKLTICSIYKNKIHHKLKF